MCVRRYCTKSAEAIERIFIFGKTALFGKDVPVLIRILFRLILTKFYKDSLAISAQPFGLNMGFMDDWQRAIRHNRWATKVI